MNSRFTCKWCIMIFCCYLFAYFSRNLLWILCLSSSIIMSFRSSFVSINDCNSFFSYILPWGQMSFWGAMVITNLFYAIPVVGADLIFLLWGGFSIDDATLHRFYSLHFTLPFIILLVSLLHVFLLHEFGSSNPTVYLLH